MLGRTFLLLLLAYAAFMRLAGEGGGGTKEKARGARERAHFGTNEHESSPYAHSHLTK